MNRPDRNGTDVRQLAASKLLGRLKAAGLYEDDDDEDTAIESLVSALGRAGSDGYEIAQCLERDGWYANAQFVEELDGGCLDEAHEELTRKWLAWHAIKPALSLHSIVAVKTKHRPIPAVGRIVSIDLKRGVYIVNVPDWGHKQIENGHEGVVLTWEDVEMQQRDDEAQSGGTTAGCATKANHD